MWTRIKKIWSKCKDKLKTIAIIALSILTSVLLILTLRRSKKIQKLKTDLTIYKSKVKLNKLAEKNQTERIKLKTLKEQNKQIREELSSIESTLNTQLKPHMTPQEIAQAFRDLGLI